MRIRTSLAPAALCLVVGCAHSGASAGAVGSVSSSLDLIVAATTDVHGRLRGWNYEANVADPVRGLSRAATIVDSLRAAAPGGVVLLDAGDLMQGNSLAFAAARVAPPDAPHPIMAAMNA